MLPAAAYKSVFPLLACTVIVGCRPNVASRPVAVVISGDTAGWIVPCGCTSNQSGGLLRRGTYVEQLRQDAEVVLIDAGGAAHGTSPYDLAKFKAILQGEAAMQTAAHNIGAAKARFGAKQLRELEKTMKTPFVSANVRDAKGRLVAKPMRLVSAAGRRIAIIGVLSDRFPMDAASDIRVSPPHPATLEALRGAAGKYDAAIVLAYMPEDELRRFAEALPEVDVVAGGPTGQPIAPTRVGPTLLTSATNKGKFLARLDAPATKADGWRGVIVEMNEQYADHPEQTANVARFHAALARADFAPCHTSFAASCSTSLPKEFAIVGTDACRKCHEEDYRLWHDSKHAAAWQSLKAKGSHVDPDCQRCHVTGYGLPGGFASVRDDSASGNRAGVGCESCHGPSNAHAANVNVRTSHYGHAKNTCLDCHDRENSPKFDYDEYWKKIVHGQETGKNVP